MSSDCHVREGHSEKSAPSGAAERVALGLIALYQKEISPYLGRRCRYYPSCSEYMSQAVRKYGMKKGMALGLRRLCRCHPLGGSGYDPVP